MFQIGISERRRLRAGSSLRRAATVLSLLILCLIPRGYVFSQQSREKEYEPAGKLLRRALEINPNHYAANFNLLTSYARAKDRREAAQAARFEDVKNCAKRRLRDSCAWSKYTLTRSREKECHVYSANNYSSRQSA